jgi:hypothetical protein
LQDLNLSEDFLSPDWFEDLYYAFLIVLDVAPFKYLRIFTSTQFVNNFILILVSPRDFKRLIKGVVSWSLNAYSFVQGVPWLMSDRVL